MGRGKDSASAGNRVTAPSRRGAQSASPGPSGEGAEITEHLGQIAQLAWSWEPDWEAVYEGEEHDWCGQASREVAAYLSQEGVQAQVRSGGLRGNVHTWVELSDKTIIDPTIEQYIDRTEDHEIDHSEVPWRDGENGDHVAVIVPSHPLHAEYETE